MQLIKKVTAIIRNTERGKKIRMQKELTEIVAYRKVKKLTIVENINSFKNAIFPLKLT